MPTALIKITQGSITDSPGVAVKGVMDGATTVVFSNGDDTGVVSWTYELLYTPPGSGISPTTQGPGVTTTYTMATPDAPGCYRVRLTVTDSAGVEDVDIRNFAVPFPNSGIIVPPYQGDPLPLPITGTGAKPDEMNFGDHDYGWDGEDDLDNRQLYLAVRALDAGGWFQLDPVQTTDTASYNIVIVPAADLLDGNYDLEIRALAREDPSTGDHAVFWRRAAFEVTSGTVTQIGSMQTPAADLKDGAAGWDVTNLTKDSSGLFAEYNGSAGDTVDWTFYYSMRKTA